MKIVIDISEKYYKKAKEWIDADTELGTVFTAIANGTPLPNEHGRLIDADSLGQELHRYTTAPYQYALKVFEDAPTIIKTNKKK